MKNQIFAHALIFELKKVGIEATFEDVGGGDYVAQIECGNNDYIWALLGGVCYYTPEHPEGILLGDYSLYPEDDYLALGFIVAIVMEHKNLFEKVGV